VPKLRELKKIESCETVKELHSLMNSYRDTVGDIEELEAYMREIDIMFEKLKGTAYNDWTGRLHRKDDHLRWGV